jgi:hypothetical protein
MHYVDEDVMARVEKPRKVEEQLFQNLAVVVLLHDHLQFAGNKALRKLF